jgi:exopolysaccharide biosynthesis predicted pyruvyltransferase EpsI
VVKTGSTNKQKAYKKMSTEASCRKYFDSLAFHLSYYYNFSWHDSYPTIGDVFFAVEQRKWRFRTRQKSQEERTSQDGFIESGSKLTEVPIISTPLNTLFDEDEWKKMKELNRITTDRIHSAILPTENDKPFIIIPDDQHNDETISLLKRVALKGQMLSNGNDLIVKKESDLSGSEPSTTPDKEIKL